MELDKRKESREKESKKEPEKGRKKRRNTIRAKSIANWSGDEASKTRI